MKRRGTDPGTGSQPRARRWTPRTTAWLTLAGVSIVAGVISYSHALTVVRAAGAAPVVAHAQPLLADLVILGASANLLDASRSGRALPKLSFLAAIIGGAVTLWMNVAAGSPHEVPSWVVNGWPAVAFGLALESLLGLIRRGRNDEPEPAAVLVCDHPAPFPVQSLDDAIIAAAASGMSKRQIALDFECSRARVDKTLPPETAPPELAAASMNGSAA
jgi:hypothetical protein